MVNIKQGRFCSGPHTPWVHPRLERLSRNYWHPAEPSLLLEPHIPVVIVAQSSGDTLSSNTSPTALPPFLVTLSLEEYIPPEKKGYMEGNFLAIPCA